ncbi:hypothetical protein [Amycolatopsis sp. CA-230715]|uniref:hypothetical protein n=1 Tax=Amycolatopsis sp. CA-230715 TaxID=2745196 RepID=UPI001C01E11A|nr:hypothetical protein [Amycolatopsis sp. CA-230715]QWF83001.1 hypothetical protein HUW46_06440 [Amycolatopsis sp. CA-230715]
MLTEIADPIGRIELTDLDLGETASTADVAHVTMACTGSQCQETTMQCHSAGGFC